MREPQQLSVLVLANRRKERNRNQFLGCMKRARCLEEDMGPNMHVVREGKPLGLFLCAAVPLTPLARPPNGHAVARAGGGRPQTERTSCVSSAGIADGAPARQYECVSKRADLVGSFLKEDNIVREVVLSYNHMGTSGVEVIAGALKRILDD